MNESTKNIILITLSVFVTVGNVFVLVVFFKRLRKLTEKFR